MDGNFTIAPLMSNNEIIEQSDLILQSPTFVKLLSNNSSGSFYIYFANSTRKEKESTGFITKRGGAYQSQSSNRIVSNKASRPILTRSDGSTISGSELWSNGWIVETLFEQRYAFYKYHLQLTSCCLETGETPLELKNVSNKRPCI